MDDGQGASRAWWTEEDGAASTIVTQQQQQQQPWDDSLPYRRDDFVKLLSSCLKGLGYRNASKSLEEESGHKAEPDGCTDQLLGCVSNGRWKEALDLLSSVQFPNPSLHARARAVLLRHRFVELVEDRHVDEALTCLREDMTPLFTASQCQEAAGPTSGDDGDPDFPRPEQALTLQKTKCIYHNTAEKIDLTEDHSCQLKMLPQVSTHILEDHTDEVWCCRFSNGGGMLATSSADAVLILWDVGSGGGGGGGNEGGTGGRGGTCPISLRQRIQVRDGAPQVLAWSPDDRWLLTCGGSSEVTRWDAASGSEARCYGGEHTEDVTEVAWLRDGRGFVSAGLDRNWGSGALGGTCSPFGNAPPDGPTQDVGGGDRESPRFTPRRKSGGCCSIKEGEHETFEGNIISGVCSPRDGSNHLLLHMDRARIWSWDPVTKKILEK
ncbi:conserved unknown protein [Ectocarpus siliculosus]|uniref:CTLH domain-containing protein n=1 Tax=Ectocarpus siliculosus TaxID=2880 RepID=D8LIZ4_ECTSI|nr:conserved unknown protein [Ectocarpus siliculosus]|eukprot:CBN76878.1 conserved unknown protein [Ectocarpus siliculosus]